MRLRRDFIFYAQVRRESIMQIRRKIMKEKLEQIKADAIREIQNSDGLARLNDVRVAFLGKKGELTAVLKGMKDVLPEERPVVGQLVNETRESIERLIEETKAKLEAAERDLKLKQEVIDVTLPAKKNRVGQTIRQRMSRIPSILITRLCFVPRRHRFRCARWKRENCRFA